MKTIVNHICLKGNDSKELRVPESGFYYVKGTMSVRETYLSGQVEVIVYNDDLTVQIFEHDITPAANSINYIYLPIGWIPRNSDVEVICPANVMFAFEIYVEGIDFS